MVIFSVLHRAGKIFTGALALHEFADVLWL
jgi:hypothetical protein